LGWGLGFETASGIELRLIRGVSVFKSGNINCVPALYHGRCTVSLWDTINVNPRVVGIPNACIASLAINSRIDDRNTARPSPPRQKVINWFVGYFPIALMKEFGFPRVSLC
jgi:hypothetical protein